MLKNIKPKIGFIGQGWIGKNYADNYEERGYTVVRYSLEEPYVNNQSEIKNCDIVFIAVPTPTDTKGFNLTYVEEALKNTEKGQNIVIKSTLRPGSTEKLQAMFPDRNIFHSPEFLSERTAKKDVDQPHANVVGCGVYDEGRIDIANQIIKTFPDSPFNLVCPSLEAEIIKYSRNIHGVFEIIFYNMFYDYVNSLGADYNTVKKYIENDPLHVARYASPIHASGHNLNEPKRGAGGHCFIKDFKAFIEDFEKITKDNSFIKILKSVEEKNIELLLSSKKDLDLLEEVYGKEIFK